MRDFHEILIKKIFLEDNEGNHFQEQIHYKLLATHSLTFRNPKTAPII